MFQIQSSATLDVTEAVARADLVHIRVHTYGNHPLLAATEQVVDSGGRDATRRRSPVCDVDMNMHDDDLPPDADTHVPTRGRGAHSVALSTSDSHVLAEQRKEGYGVGILPPDQNGSVQWSRKAWVGHPGEATQVRPAWVAHQPSPLAKPWHRTGRMQPGADPESWCAPWHAACLRQEVR